MADDAPQGKAYGRVPVRQGLLVISPHVPGVPGSPHLLSFWLKSSTDCWAAIEFGSDETMRTAGDHYPGTPSTDNQRRRVGYYFWWPVQCQTVRFHIRCQQELPEGDYLAVDDFQLRTASEAATMRYRGSGRERRFLDGGSRPQFKQGRPVWHAHAHHQSRARGVRM